MTPLQISARFAAFTWYTTHCQEAASPRVSEKAKRFAEANWRVFLPVAHEGWGRLLLRIAKTSSTTHKRRLAAAKRPRVAVGA